MRTSFLFALAGLSVSLAQSPTPQPISSGLYDTLVYYAQFPKAAGAAEPCPNPPNGSVVVSYVDTGSGFFNSNVHAILFRVDSRREFIIGWAGTNNTQNLWEDLDPILEDYPGCSGCQVDQGFYESYKTAVPMVSDNLQTAYSDSAYADYNLTVTGYSLGGAFADLHFADLATANQYPLNPVYTYGEPRVGNQQYADHIDSLSGSSSSETNPGRYFRVTHADDPVPNLPPKTPYIHPQNEYWEQNGTNGVPSAETTVRCFGQEPMNCNEANPSLDFAAHVSYPGFEGGMC